jgi:predicted nuclease of predicted toxin-antitoxin system
MSAPRFLTDEDVYSDVAVVLRNQGFDAISTPEAGRLTVDDPEQLEWAANQGRVLMTFNVGDFVALHGEWLRTGRHHAGLIVSAQRPPGETLRRLLNLAASLSAEDLRDRLEFLTNWPEL